VGGEGLETSATAFPALPKEVSWENDKQRNLNKKFGRRGLRNEICYVSVLRKFASKFNIAFAEMVAANHLHDCQVFKFV
jgi:hypothetical protein